MSATDAAINTPPAFLHLAIGVLEKKLKDAGEVPVGIHDLGGQRVVIQLPPGSSVIREAGANGDGTEPYAAARNLTLLAVLLYLEETGWAGPGHESLWKKCVHRAIERSPRAEDLLPREAAQAIEEGQKALPPSTRKTSAKKIGVAACTVAVEPIPKVGRARKAA